MKLASLALACLALVAIECAVLRPFGLSVARSDVAVAAVLFFGLRCQTLEGAFASFAAGYFVDVLSGQPSGLYVFTAVLTYLVARLIAPFVEVRSARRFALLAAGLDVLHNLAALGLLLLSAQPEASRRAMLSAIPLTALLTSVAALVAWPVLRFAEGAFKKQESGIQM
jgi:rod shape-determining protein MreD